MQPKNGKFPLLILNRKQTCLFLTDLRLLFDLGLNMALATPGADPAVHHLVVIPSTELCVVVLILGVTG